ncbi:hypothetical protein DH2020_017580 [Rehmannia glutinosa]|uniref:Uncharacterized protein n=1 Tax=Rehmannia glutinosa TaxID=99300 RepID=A0ABR0WV26_REHGL
MVGHYVLHVLDSLLFAYSLEKAHWRTLLTTLRIQLTTTLGPMPQTLYPENSLGTPIYLNLNHSIATNTTNSSNVPESEAPQEFLSEPFDFPQTHHSSPHENQAKAERSSLDDDIELLMQLLCLSELNEREEGVIDVGCDDGFYGNIVGVKGPKSLKEVERLEGWIKHFLKGEKKEPLRLAHLLLGKAVFLHSGDDCDGFGGFVFPSTIDEFLQNDPPVD